MQVRDPSAVGVAGTTVQTAQVRLPYDQISSILSNAALESLHEISIYAGQDAAASFIKATVNGVVRLPGSASAGGVSLVVLLTSLGRIVVNGTTMSAAAGDLEAATDADLFRMALAETGSHGPQGGPHF
jgi:hypothetical protein